MRHEKKIRVLKMISDDMAQDVRGLDGKPFNGHTVAESLGTQAAAIAALANILKSILETEE